MPDVNPLYIFLGGLGVLLILLHEGLRRVVTLIVLVIVVISAVKVFAPAIGS